MQLTPRLVPYSQSRILDFRFGCQQSMEGALDGKQVRSRILDSPTLTMMAFGRVQDSGQL